MAEDDSTEDMDQDEPQFEFRIVGFDEAPPHFANDVFVSIDPGGLQVVFTQFLPPPVVTVSDQERIAELGFVPNHVVARVVLSPLVAQRLIMILQERLVAQQQMADEYASYLDDEGGDGSKVS